MCAYKTDIELLYFTCSKVLKIHIEVYQNTFNKNNHFVEDTHLN